MPSSRVLLVNGGGLFLLLLSLLLSFQLVLDPEFIPSALVPIIGLGLPHLICAYFIWYNKFQLMLRIFWILLQVILVLLAIPFWDVLYYQLDLDELTHYRDLADVLGLLLSMIIPVLVSHISARYFSTFHRHTGRSL